MQRLGKLVWVALSATLLLGANAAVQAQAAPFWQPVDSTDRESYVAVPMPPGVQVVHTELEGPVFADAQGRTLYTWPLSTLRNGPAGDRRNSGVATCDGTIYQETSGLMSPYPGGFLLPELDKRQSCEQLWPPLLAPEDAKPVGKWTLAKRTNGQSQWSYDGQPVYTSSLDRQPGDVLGASKLRRGEAGALRLPIAPPSDVPPEFAVVAFATGRMLVDHKDFSVYYSDADAPGKSNCTGECLETWKPVLAPQAAKQNDEWSIVERSSGVKQWAYRGRPLYTYVLDTRTRSVTGSDVPGWHNAYTQRSLPPPAEFTVQDSRIGQVLADSRGMTIYHYNCNDDAMDQQSCDHPDATQAYRLAICGKGDPKLCQETFPYVEATPGATSDSRLWTVMEIDPNTGHRAQSGQADGLHVWAYRERPVYTFARDSKPGDADGDAWGEFNGARNGFKAFWLRDDFRSNTYGR